MDQGVDCTLHYSTIEPGAGAPLHIHEVDELITVLEGQVEGRIGEDKATVVANQTMVIPKGVAHGFTASGEGTAVALAFFPCSDGMQNTTYVEGEPPEAYRK
jgi:quercetin dioxygenase-like cupin family protein